MATAAQRVLSLEAAQASASLDQCINTLDALKLAYSMLRCTHASFTLLGEMENLIESARVELDLSDD